MSMVPVLFSVSPVPVWENVVVPVPVFFMRLPELLNVAVPLLLFTLPSPVAVSVPELLNVPPDCSTMLLFPLQVAPVLCVVNVRWLSVTLLAVVLIVSAAVGTTVVEPVPDCVPADHVKLLSTVRAPAPLIVEP